MEAVNICAENELLVILGTPTATPPAWLTKNGGVVILSSRCGVKDKNAHYRAEKAPGVFKNIAKCRCDWFTSIANPAKQLVEMNGKKYPVNIYCEMLESEGAEIIARYTDGFLKDKAAVTKNGNVYYVGYYTESLDNIYFDLVKEHISPIPEYDMRLERVPFGRYEMCMNHTGETLDLVGHDVIKERDISPIKPFDVVLIERKS